VSGDPLHRVAPRGARHPAAWLVAGLVVLPVVLFGLPAVLGNTWLFGDNLIQNFPLRVLVGTDLRHGHLPLWDPLLWSGSVLLSGFNAGAAYPTTWLFAVLPGVLAWVVNQAIVEVVAGLGMVALLRCLRRSWVASGLGGLAFAYGGFIAAQGVHIDVVQAAAWLPWGFVALDRLAHRPEGRSAAPWVALLGASLGLMGLSGAAEPLIDGGLALALYAAWLLWRTPGRRRSLALGAAVGLGVGLLVAGAQLVPGALIQAQSQRAVHDYWYFTSGSMNKSMTLLGLDPALLGVDHPEPTAYFGTYNLAEVSGYIGIMAAMGFVGLLARRHRRSPDARTWWIWYAIAGLGLLLCWGDFTPLGHVFFHVPLFNRQRLLSRNLLEVDLALAVLFATWVDRMLLAPQPSTSVAPPSDEADRTPRHGQGRHRQGRHRQGDREGWWRRLPGPGGWRSDVVLPLLPALAVVGLQVVLLAGGAWLPDLMHAPGPVSRSSLWSLVTFLSIPSAIALAAAWLVVRRDRLRRYMPALLFGLLVLDLAVFNFTVQNGPDPRTAASATTPMADALANTVTADGQGPAGGVHRVALFDPDRFYFIESDWLGEPDLTILRNLPSVQGYGAVVDAGYDRATATHLQLNMAPQALADGTFARLDLGVLVSTPQYFVHLVTPPPGQSGAGVNGATWLPPVPPDPSAPTDATTPPPTPPSVYVYTSPPPATVTLSPGQSRTQYFGTILSVRSVTLPVEAGGGAVRVGLVGPDGSATTWIGTASSPPGASSVTVDVGATRAASGIVLEASGTGAQASSPAQVGAAVVRTAGQGTYRVDGSLRDVVAPAQWRFVRTIGPFGVFLQPSAKGRAWVEGAAGTARVVTSTPWGDDTIEVNAAAPATLVRSEQFATGWHATVTPAAPGRHGQAAVVSRAGLLQSVRVPAGESLVRFTYRPHRAVEGLVASAAGVACLVALVLWPTLRRRLRRRRHQPAN
jgi:hypothetical protein